jgi:hypothetical protein
MLFPLSTCKSGRTGKPLLALYSESRAHEEASRVKQRYNNDQTPYLCSVCQLWHLKPKQWRECSYCCGRDGRYKISYPTEAVAEEQAARLSESSYTRLRVYECRHENAWHLTHTNR